MAKLARRQSGTRLPDLFDWMESPWATLLPFGPGQTFRVEDYTEDGTYVVRAELPGLDPDKDIDVTADSGVLTIRAERREEHEEPHHSEFRYGSLTRSVTLPATADTKKITASYDNGILQVSVPLDEARVEGRKIAVSKGS